MEDLINQRLREFLKAQGITQKEFCEAIRHRQKGSLLFSEEVSCAAWL